MKRKFIPIVALASIMMLGSFATALSSCDNNEQKEEDKKVTSISVSLDKSSIEVGSTANVTVVVNPADAKNKEYELALSDTSVASIAGSKITALKAGTTKVTATAKDGSGVKGEATLTVTASVIKVSSITLKLSANTVEVGSTVTASVEFVPNNAEDKTYKLTSSDTSVASIDKDNVITGLKAGKTTITATSNDGAKTSSVELTVTEVPSKFELTASLSATTVAAGEKVTFTMGAKDKNGKDISSTVEVEDYDDSSSIDLVKKEFCSKIAGKHTINFFVEDEFGNNDEKNIEINVTPATPNTFTVTDAENDPDLVGNFGEFKENFEKGNSSTIFKGNTDSNHAGTIDGTSDAIEGNSLIIDFNKTAGSAANSLFLSSFNDSFKRGTAVTYEVSFDYKVLTTGSMSDVYFGLSWDGSSGINNQFVADTTVGKVNSYSYKFTEATIPTGGNAYFFFFKLAANATDCKIAVDNFVIKAIKPAETTITKPTAEQLATETGYTYNWHDKANTFEKGETLLVDNLEDPIKSSIKADTASFGENVMHLTNKDGHTFGGLDSTNLVAGKDITITFDYYNVNDGGWKMIVMNGGVGDTRVDPTLTVKSGNIKTFTWTTSLKAGDAQINFYPTVASFDVYVGNMTIKTVDTPEAPKDVTEAGNHVGDSWTVSTRSFGSETKAFGKIECGIATPSTVTGEKIGTTIDKLTFNSTASNATMEWYRASNKQLESGHKYTIELIYYIEAYPAGSRFMLNFDNAVFLDLDGSVGYHDITLNWTATKNVDFFSWFAPDDASDGVVYLAKSIVTLTEI